MRERIENAERIVVKIGSSTLTYDNSRLNLNRIEKLIRDLVNLKNQEKEVIVVSSGAVAAGYGELKLSKSPGTIPEKQALAAVGQGTLMKTYQKLFSEYGHRVAQILLTQADLTDRQRYLNSRNTISQLLEYDVIPVINENDTVAVKEIKFGDNDTLSALVSSLIDADLLVILSDIEGLYTADPRKDESAELISEVKEITDEIEELAGGAGTVQGTGGMVTKIEAAKITTRAGIPMVITRGDLDNCLSRLISGEELGTVFHAKSGLRSRDKWIAFNLGVSGQVIVDKGAAKALIEEGCSLLPCGVVGIEGDFQSGDVVDVVDEEGRKLARGLVNYSYHEIDQIKGLHSSEIESKLGYQGYEEVVHRNNLVCF